MSFQLFADPFTEADQPTMAGLHCGDEPWARAATTWITGSDVLDSIQNHGTRVWIFRDESDSIIGFASLGTTRWRWPPPDGKLTRLLIVPQLGISKRFRGQPPDPTWRFSNQIMRHVIFEAREWASEIRQTRPAKKHVDLLMLEAHKNNLAAHRLYERFGFVAIPDFETKNHIVMSHRLVAPENSS